MGEAKLGWFEVDNFKIQNYGSEIKEALFKVGFVATSVEYNAKRDSYIYRGTCPLFESLLEEVMREYAVSFFQNDNETLSASFKG